MLWPEQCLNGASCAIWQNEKTKWNDLPKATLSNRGPVDDHSVKVPSSFCLLYPVYTVEFTVCRFYSAESTPDQRLPEAPMSGTRVR